VAEIKIKASVEESELRKSVKADLADMYNTLSDQLKGIKDITITTLKSSDKILKNTTSVQTSTKDLALKVSKIMDTADKIATDTSKYHNAILSRPIHTNRSSTDPKVLGNMECKSKQILINIFDTEGNNTLGKSPVELLAKANEVI
jgi:hypothetical protein